MGLRTCGWCTAHGVALQGRGSGCCHSCGAFLIELSRSGAEQHQGTGPPTAAKPSEKEFKRRVCACLFKKACFRNSKRRVFARLFKEARFHNLKRRVFAAALNDIKGLVPPKAAKPGEKEACQPEPRTLNPEP